MTQSSNPTDVVCLSQGFDLKPMFVESFARHAAQLRLCDPDDVVDPQTIQYALAHDPAPDAFQRFPKLSLVCAWGAGVDGLLLHPGLPPNVMIKRMTDPGQAQMMAAFAAYYVTGWQRRMFEYPALQAAHEWRELNALAPCDCPVGLLGFGKMGAAIGVALQAMGFPVCAWASRAREEQGVSVLSGEAGFARVIEDSMAIINVLPLTPDTHGILSSTVFARMRPDAILIQLARGAHLVEPDLIAALDAGRPAMAALDVMMQEPLPPENPLWSHPRIMITPHIASTASPSGVAQSVLHGIAAHQTGQLPDGLVDRLRGY